MSTIKSGPHDDIDFSLLDQLRGLAALGVVVGHSRGLLFAGGQHLQNQVPIDQWGMADKISMGLLSLTRLSSEFVIFFFILSGFSIAHSLRRNPAPLGFYSRRALRLYPTYLAALAWAAGIFMLTRAWRPDFYAGAYNQATFIKLAASKDFLSLSNLLYNLAYLPQGFLIAPFWSLSHEVLFYIVAPFVCARIGAYLLFSLAAYTASWVLTGNGFAETNVLIDFILHYNFYFAIGVAAYRHWGDIQPSLTFPPLRVLIFLVLIYLFSVALGIKLGGISKITALLFSVASLLLMANCHTHKWRVPWLRMIGAASYTIYATHFASLILLLAVVHSVIAPPHIYSKTLWMVGIPWCLALAAPSYFLVEKMTRQRLESLRAVAN